MKLKEEKNVKFVVSVVCNCSFFFFYCNIIITRKNEQLTFVVVILVIKRKITKILEGNFRLIYLIHKLN